MANPLPPAEQGTNRKTEDESSPNDLYEKGEGIEKSTRGVFTLSVIGVYKTRRRSKRSTRPTGW